MQRFIKRENYSISIMAELKLQDFNPWWEDKNWFEKEIYLYNLKKQKIIWNYKIIDKFEEGIYSLRGPRQVGKTSWIKCKIKELLNNGINNANILFYSCEYIDKEELSEIITSFLSLSNSGKKYIFLDEIPFVKGWEFVIKHIYETGKLQNCFLLLSGSNSLDIKRSVERLPGRGDAGKRHFIMGPLLFKEYLEAIGAKIGLTGDKKRDEAYLKINFNIIKKHFQDYLLTGGFLKIMNEYFDTGKISDTSYDIYLKWIIGDLAKFDLKEKYAKQILRRVIETYTSEISWSSLKSGTEIDSPHTALKYADALEEMFILQTIYKMDFNKKIPNYPKSKKVYFSDPFIFSCCFKWVNSTEDNFNRYKKFIEDNVDRISEGVLLNHLVSILNKRTKSNIFKYSDVIYYWTNKSKKKEVDFVCNNPAFEVKYQNKINTEDYSGLKDFKKGYLLTKETFGKNTFPLAVFLLILSRFL
jgi:predicted AAA+ superfamily ATPase